MILSSLTSICQNTTARKYKIHERHLKSNLANNTVFPPKGVTSEGKNVLASCARFSLSPLLPPCPREIFHQKPLCMISPVEIFQWIVYMNYFHSALSEILHSPMWDFPSIQLKDFDSNRTWDNYCSVSISIKRHVRQLWLIQPTKTVVMVFSPLSSSRGSQIRWYL